MSQEDVAMPNDFDVIVIGSGPGGLRQTSHYETTFHS